MLFLFQILYIPLLISSFSIFLFLHISKLVYILSKIIIKLLSGRKVNFFNYFLIFFNPLFIGIIIPFLFLSLLNIKRKYYILFTFTKCLFTNFLNFLRIPFNLIIFFKIIIKSIRDIKKLIIDIFIYKAIRIFMKTLI